MLAEILNCTVADSIQNTTAKNNYVWCLVAHMSSFIACAFPGVCRSHELFLQVKGWLQQQSIVAVSMALLMKKSVLNLL